MQARQASAMHEDRYNRLHAQDRSRRRAHDDRDEVPLAVRRTLPRARQQRVGDAASLTQFGVNVTRLPAGTWSNQRHGHEREDELMYVLEGEVVLVEDEGEEVLRRGECAGFKAGARSGHHLQNRSNADALVLTIGTRDHTDSGEYPDIDMKFGPERYAARGRYSRRDGTPY